jgi:hypothetical protein
VIGTIGSILGFGVLALGMYVSFQFPTSPQLLLLPWITLALGILLLQVGKFYAVRYGTRVDRALAQALKGLDNRYHLYNFQRDLPVEHLLATPNGLVVLETRPFFGEVINEGATWSRPVNLRGIFQLFTDGGIGNPTRDAERDVEAVQSLLRERLGDAAEAIPVSPVVVFTNPRVKLKVSEPEVPVVELSGLRAALRQSKENRRLPPDLQRRLVRALQPEGVIQGTPVTTSRSDKWQRSQK